MAEAATTTRSLKARQPEPADDVPNVKACSIEKSAGASWGATSKADPSRGSVKEKAQVFEVVAALQKPVLNGPVAPSKASPPKPDGVPESKQRKMPTPPTPSAPKTRKTDEQGTPASSVRPKPVPKTPPSHPPSVPLRYDIAGGDQEMDPAPKETEQDLWWKLQEQDVTLKASVLAAKEKELIDRAAKLAAREAEVAALKGSVIDEGSGIAEGLIQTQRQQEQRDREQSAREKS